jgi:hypothetical protein
MGRFNRRCVVDVVLAGLDRCVEMTSAYHQALFFVTVGSAVGVMPVSIYHNDGSGRDSYVNNSMMTETQRKSARGMHDSFWPNTTMMKERSRIDMMPSPRDLSSSMVGSFDLNSPSRLPSVPLSPVSRQRQSYLPAPKKVFAVGDAFALRGQVSPRSPRREGPSNATYETTAGFAGRTGRFVLPAEAPQLSPRLPGIKLHTRVGVLDEI